MKRLLPIVVFFFTVLLYAQQKEKETPNLVVWIIVDQMRYDYLTRFYNKYGDEGFKRLINEGFNCKNNHFNYIPTKTAPGHTSVYTGSTPKYHGVIANYWYDKELKEMVYCVSDTLVRPVGTKSNAGRMSPRRMLSTTFADENKMFTQQKGKTIGISVKDRAAILPAGHTADAAYWFYGKDEGVFVSSTYYLEELPKWVKKYNNSGKIKSYLKTWDTYYDINTYTESTTDLNNFEYGFKGKETTTFPYDLKKLSKDNDEYDILKTTPFGNSLVTDLAIEALSGENLGKGNFTDILTISYSSTDYIGHNFGVSSKEIEDTYIRLDLELARLLKALDKQVGEGEYTLFLTADHAAVEVPAYLLEHRIPGGYVNAKEEKEALTAFLIKTYGENLAENVSNDQIFLNRERIQELKLDLAQVQEAIVNQIITYNDVYKAYTASSLSKMAPNYGVEKLLENGFNQKRSGDILIVKNPAVINYSKKGSTHGSGYTYDTHVPLLFFGKGIKKGSTFVRTEIVDVAPTISAMLGTSFPNSAIGNPLVFVYE